MNPNRSLLARLGIPKAALLLAGSALVLAPRNASAAAVVFNQPAGASWNDPVNWTPNDVPETAGDTAIFNSAMTASNPEQTANRPVTLDGPKTVGSIVFNNDSGTFTNSITTGTGGPLTLGDGGAGPATITTMGTGAATNSISVATILADSLIAVVNNITASSGSGSLNLTAAISGPGGFSKQGDGLATFGTGLKTYSGPTVLSGGRMRISSTAQPSGTSSFTIQAGAQLTLLNGAGGTTYNFGSGPLNLNGTGATTGPFAIFPGAIRNNTDIPVTIGNAVVLQTETLLHVEGAASGVITFTNTVSGPGSLTLTAPSSSANQGRLILDGANSYEGDTFVNGGTLVASGENATLGLGDVMVDNALSPDSNAKLTIETGVLNAIADTATLSLAGGRDPVVADTGFVELGAGVNERVAALLLGGASQTFGTYGSTASPASFKDDEYFAGTGIITVIPEPGTAALLLAGLAPLLARRHGAHPRN